MSDAPPQRLLSVRFNPEISLGQAIQAVVVAVGFIVGVTFYTNRVDTTAHDVGELKVDVTKQLAAMQISVDRQLTAMQLSADKQFASIKVDIANLPDVRAELTQIGRRVDQADGRANALSDRVGQALQQGYRNTADIEAMARASSGKPR